MLSIIPSMQSVDLSRLLLSQRQAPERCLQSRARLSREYEQPRKKMLLLLPEYARLAGSLLFDYGMCLVLVDVGCSI
eukprot:6177841-Pleurochrysis_carterae.AAC.1